MKTPRVFMKLRAMLVESCALERRGIALLLSSCGKLLVR